MMTRLRKTGLALSALTALALGGLWLWRIPLAVYVATSTAQSFGVQDLRLDISELGWHETVIEELAIGDEIILRGMTVQYTVGDLIGGEIASIALGQAQIDLSHPNEGSLRQIQDAASGLGGSTDTSSNAVPKLPRISFKDVTLHYAKDATSADLSLVGEVMENGEFAVNAQLSGQGQAADIPLKISSETIQLSGNLLDARFGAVVEGVSVRSDTETPAFAALYFRAQAVLENNNLTANMTAGLEDGQALFDADIAHSFEGNAGHANIQIAPLVLGQGALQPDLLFAGLNLPPLRAGLNGTLTASWTQGGVSANGNFIISEGVVDLQGPQISLKEAKITTHTDVALGDVIPIPETEIIFAGLNLKSDTDILTAEEGRILVGGTLSDLKGELTVAIKGQAGGGKIPPSKLILKAAGKPDALSLTGNLSSFKGAFNPTVTGLLNLPVKSGLIEIMLPSTKLGKDAVALDPWVGMPLSGAISALGKIEISDAVPTFHSLQMTADKVTADIDADRRVITSAQLSTKDVTPAQPFNIEIAKLSGSIRDGDREFQFQNGMGAAAIEADGQSGTFMLQPLELKPTSKNPWKVPITIRSDGTFKKTDLTFKGRADTPFTGALAEWQGRHRLSSSKGEVTFKLLTLPFSDGGLQPSDFWRKDFNDLIVTGDIAASGKFHWGAGEPNGSATFEVSNLSAAQEGMLIEGLDGTVKIDSLLPLKITEAQTVRVGRMFAGLPLGKTEIVFRLQQEEDAPVLHLDRVLVEMFKGSAEIKDGIIDLGRDSNKLQMNLYRLSLEDLMALGEFDDVNATGALSGTIPLNFNGEKLIIDDAVLAAEEPGVLQIRSEQARLALSAGGSQTKLLLDILEDFKYSNLSLRINKPEVGDDVISLHAEGGNPSVEENRPVVLNVNLSTNFDKIFNTVLEGYRLSEQALRATVRNRNK